jgi:hypothetical protein
MTFTEWLDLDFEYMLICEGTNNQVGSLIDLLERQATILHESLEYPVTDEDRSVSEQIQEIMEI